MDKMRMESVDIVAQNIEKIGILFPNCITESFDENGKPKKAINFELLKQMLSGDVLEGGETYEFTWVGKKAAIVEANKPIRKTLRPCKDESVNWDSTENLYIEGDNLEVLKLLQESYLGKVKMIYIDPPYNTGSDFIYNDDFKMSDGEYNDESGAIDEVGNRLFKNSDSNGRFHSDWCSMIYSRMILARNLLKTDGAIFISIDEHEVENLKKIGHEVFGASNFVGSVIWERAFAPKNDAKFFSDSHDYILVYAKSLNDFSIGLLPRTEEANARYKNPDNDPRGPWAADNMTVKTYSAAYDYPITTPKGTVVSPTNGRCWFTSKERMQKLIDDGMVWFGSDGGNMPRIKRYLADVQQGMTPTTIWKYEEVGHNQEGRQELKKLFNGKGYFDGPKPQRLMQRLMTIANLGKKDIVLDFFSGSASTAHAVFNHNIEHKSSISFIMVQLPEQCEEESDAYKDGYNSICDIGKERIKRAGNSIREANPSETQDLDIGFRVLKLDDSNMNDVYYSSAEYSQNLLSVLESNVKIDRNDLDLLFGCLLEWGLLLSLPYSSEQIDGCTVHNYNNGDLIACFDENVPDSVIKEIAKRRPLRAVFRDSSFANSPAKINVGEIFKLMAPDTRVKVI